MQNKCNLRVKNMIYLASYAGSGIIKVRDGEIWRTDYEEYQSFSPRTISIFLI